MAAKVDCYATSDLTARQKAALRYADAHLMGPGCIDASLRAEVCAQLTPAEVVELALDISKWSTQKVPVALGSDVEINPGGLATFDFDSRGKVVWGKPI